MNANNLFVEGPQSELYKPDIEKLVQGIIPDNWEKINSSKRTIVIRQLTAGRAYYKEYLPRSGIEGIKSLIKGDRAERAIKQGKLLLEDGFKTPEILCSGKFKNHSFIIFNGVDAEPIGGYIKSNWNQCLSQKEKTFKYKIITTLAQEVANMHLCGIVHGDLRLNNILLQIDTNEIPSYHFLDNERNNNYQTIPRKLIIKNLLQLNLISPKLVSFNDRLRFFHVYNKKYSSFSMSEQKKMANEIWELTLRRFKRESLRDCYEDLENMKLN